MYFRSSIFAVIISLLLFFFIIELIRRRKLQERYSLLWLLVVILMMSLSLSRGSLDFFSRMVGIYYPPAALFLLGMLFVVVLLLHFSLVVSQLVEKNKILAQKIALLENKIGDREKG